jgi:nucleoside-diphosphate-sugar epimerase
MPRQEGRAVGRRVFVAGASGVIGRALVPELVRAGHHVIAMTRFEEKLGELRSLGAEAVVCDVFDVERLRRVVAEARPDAVVNQLTDLPKSGLKARRLAEYYARNDRVRREGTLNLVAAAREAGAKRYIAQSVAFFYAPEGPWVKDEDAPLWTAGPSPFGAAAKAIEDSERAVLETPELEGIVLRYGTFYGPGTWYAADGEIGRQMKRRQYPNIGPGEGVTSFVHVGDAAEACVAFVGRGAPGVYNVVDDDPAAASEWMPVFAEAIGAKPPRRVPVWLANLIAGRALVEWATTLRGASNDRIKRALGWKPAYSSWRQGFREGLA